MSRPNDCRGELLSAIAELMRAHGKLDLLVDAYRDANLPAKEDAALDALNGIEQLLDDLERLLK